MAAGTVLLCHRCSWSSYSFRGDAKSRGKCRESKRMMAAGVVVAAASFVTFPLLVLIPICTLVRSLAVPVLQLLQPCLQYKWWPWWEVSTMCLYPHKSWPRQCCWQYTQPRFRAFSSRCVALSSRTISTPRAAAWSESWSLGTQSPGIRGLSLDRIEHPTLGAIGWSRFTTCRLSAVHCASVFFVKPSCLNLGVCSRRSARWTCRSNCASTGVRWRPVRVVCVLCFCGQDLRWAEQHECELISGTNILGDHIPVDEDAKFVLALEN